MHGKRADSEHSKPAWRNMVRPTGFMFSMAKGKKSDESSENFVDEMTDNDVDVDETSFDELSTDVDEETVESRDRRSAAVEPNDFNTFFAGRGKKDGTSSSSMRADRNPTRAESFFAGRGKKGNGNDLDMFVAGRGK